MQDSRQDVVVERLAQLPAKRNGIVYLIRFHNGKGYVRQTMQRLKQRVSQHVKNKSGCKALSAAIRKYGGDSFHVNVLTRVPEDRLNAEERRLISEYNTLVPNGYNILPGGEQLHDPQSQEAMRQVRMRSTSFQNARKEIQKRPSTTLNRRITTSAKRNALISKMDVVAADRTHYDAWRHAYRHARRSVQNLQEGSSRDPFEGVASHFGAGKPSRDPNAVALIKARRSAEISSNRRDNAMKERRKRIQRMTSKKAFAFMKRARCNALSIAKNRTPDKLEEVRMLWEKEWEEFEHWLRTRDPPASASTGKKRTSDNSGTERL